MRGDNSRARSKHANASGNLLPSCFAINRPSATCAMAAGCPTGSTQIARSKCCRASACLPSSTACSPSAYHALQRRAAEPNVGLAEKCTRHRDAEGWGRACRLAHSLQHLGRPLTCPAPLLVLRPLASVPLLLERRLPAVSARVSSRKISLRSDSARSRMAWTGASRSAAPDNGAEVLPRTISAPSEGRAACDKQTQAAGQLEVACHPPPAGCGAVGCHAVAAEYGIYY